MYNISVIYNTSKIKKRKNLIYVHTKHKNINANIDHIPNIFVYFGGSYLKYRSTKQILNKLPWPSNPNVLRSMERSRRCPKNQEIVDNQNHAFKKLHEENIYYLAQHNDKLIPFPSRLAILLLPLALSLTWVLPLQTTLRRNPVHRCHAYLCLGKSHNIYTYIYIYVYISQ